MKKIITITGPTGSGKTEFLKTLCKTGDFKTLVSHTTRQKRASETDGVDYFFSNERWFKEELEAGNFVQYVDFRGILYGTHINTLREAFESGKTPAIVVEPTGVFQFQRVCEKMLEDCEVLPIFISATPEVLIARYLARFNKEDYSDPEKRTYNARRISGILSEAKSWALSAPYQIFFNNDEDDLEKLEVFSNQINSLFTGEKQ